MQGNQNMEDDDFINDNENFDSNQKMDSFQNNQPNQGNWGINHQNNQIVQYGNNIGGIPFGDDMIDENESNSQNTKNEEEITLVPTSIDHLSFDELDSIDHRSVNRMETDDFVEPTNTIVHNILQKNSNLKSDDFNEFNKRMRPDSFQEVEIEQSEIDKKISLHKPKKSLDRMDPFFEPLSTLPGYVKQKEEEAFLRGFQNRPGNNIPFIRDEKSQEMWKKWRYEQNKKEILQIMYLNKKKKNGSKAIRTTNQYDWFSTIQSKHVCKWETKQ